MLLYDFIEWVDRNADIEVAISPLSDIHRGIIIKNEDSSIIGTEILRFLSEFSIQSAVTEDQFSVDEWYA